MGAGQSPYPQAGLPRQTVLPSVSWLSLQGKQSHGHEASWAATGYLSGWRGENLHSGAFTPVILRDPGD